MKFYSDQNLFISDFLLLMMKTLPPTLRENKRYLLIRCENPRELIEKVILEFIGVLGYAEASVKFIEVKGNEAIVAINREALNKVRAAFAVSKENIKVERVSGTLKGLRKRR